jgi:hypothetical protein
MDMISLQGNQFLQREVGEYQKKLVLHLWPRKNVILIRWDFLIGYKIKCFSTIKLRFAFLQGGVFT